MARVLDLLAHLMVARSVCDREQALEEFRAHQKAVVVDSKPRVVEEEFASLREHSPE
jgi:hypothetical protein